LGEGVVKEIQGLFKPGYCAGMSMSAVREDVKRRK
jgi:hypothetical protein